MHMLRRPLAVARLPMGVAAALPLAAPVAGAPAPAATDQYVALWRRQADGRLRIEPDHHHLPGRPLPVRPQ